MSKIESSPISQLREMSETAKKVKEGLSTASSPAEKLAFEALKDFIINASQILKQDDAYVARKNKELAKNGGRESFRKSVR